MKALRVHEKKTSALLLKILLKHRPCNSVKSLLKLETKRTRNQTLKLKVQEFTSGIMRFWK